MKKFDMVLLEKPLEEGLKIEEIAAILAMTNDEAFIPVEIQGENSSAMGFIGVKKAEEINYVYLEGSGLYQYVQDILEDMDNETPDGTYKYKTKEKVPVKIFLTMGIAA